MIVASMQVPTLDELTKKEQSIKEAMNYKFNDKDIEDVSSGSGQPSTHRQLLLSSSTTSKTFWGGSDRS